MNYIIACLLLAIHFYGWQINCDFSRFVKLGINFPWQKLKQNVYKRERKKKNNANAKTELIVASVWFSLTHLLPLLNQGIFFAGINMMTFYKVFSLAPFSVACWSQVWCFAARFGLFKHHMLLAFQLFSSKWIVRWLFSKRISILVLHIYRTHAHTHTHAVSFFLSWFVRQMNRRI